MTQTNKWGKNTEARTGNDSDIQKGKDERKRNKIPSSLIPPYR